MHQTNIWLINSMEIMDKIKMIEANTMTTNGDKEWKKLD
jgi:hypothetical protein